MAGEAQRVYGTQITLEANGASIANNAIGQADDANVDLSDDTPADSFDGEFALTVNYSVAPTAGTSISLILRPLDIDGTTDAPAPTATYLNEFFGSFLPNAATGSQTLRCFATDVPREFAAYLYNNATGQTIPAAWTLKFTPVTYKPAA
jgi:hypothetical protein